MARLLPIALLTLVLALGGVACGGDDSDGTATTGTTATETTSADGREVFVANCGSCHALSDAGTSGTIGPDLDQIGLSAADVESQVRSGGGGMPAFEGQLSDDEIAQVSAYVAENDGS